jgi:hypothetical protein
VIKYIYNIKTRSEADEREMAKEKYRLAKQLNALKTLVGSCIALETSAKSYFHLPADLLKIKENGQELVEAVQKLSGDFSDAFEITETPYDRMTDDVKKTVAILQSAIDLKSSGQPSGDLAPEAARSVFFQHLATLLKIIRLAEEVTYDEIAREAIKLPLRHRAAFRIVTLSASAALIFLLAFSAAFLLSGDKKASQSARQKDSQSLDGKGQANAALVSQQGNNPSDEHQASRPQLPARPVLGNPQGIAIGPADSTSSDQSSVKKDQRKATAVTSDPEKKGSNDEEKAPFMTFVALIVVGISGLLATLWAIQSYWRLVIIDERDKRWRPPESDSEWSGPYAFHSLAQSHNEWAQLWFSWCVAIFLGGVTYAIYNSTHVPPKGDGQWTTMLLIMLSSYLHHGLVYALFGFAWYWASKHYRSHWHNYVANAYRHRSLYRFELLRTEIPQRMMGAPAEYEKEAN